MKKLAHFWIKNHFTIILCGVALLTEFIVATVLISLSMNRLHQIAGERLESEANSFLALSEEHFQGGVTTLRSLRGFYAGSQSVERSEFYDFIRHSNFFDTYSGFSTVAYIQPVDLEKRNVFESEVRSDTSFVPEGYPKFSIKPVGERKTYWPIVYIAPEDKYSFLLGADQATDQVRFENIQRAVTQGDISVSTLVDLAQGGKGLIVVEPLYIGNEVPTNPEEREKLSLGVVSSVIDLTTFFSQIIPQTNVIQKQITITALGRGNTPVVIYEGKETASLINTFYGDITTDKSIALTSSTNYEFSFTAPISALLSEGEKFEPLLLGLFFLIAAVCICGAIIISQRFKSLSDIRKQYQFIGTLSHQLRTPLTRLNWGIEMMTSNSQPDENQIGLMESTKMLQSLINKLLFYLEINKHINWKKEQVSAGTLWQKVLELSPKDFDEKRLVIYGKEVTADIRIDVEKTAQAIADIVDNALTYSPKDTKVELRIFISNHDLVIAISDLGYGIPAQEQDKVFSEFFRATNAPLGKNVGSGVSLYIAKKIIDQQGGSVSFISIEKQGSTFTIKLPLVK